MNHRLFREVQRWCDRNYPGDTPLQLTIQLQDGRAATLPIPRLPRSKGSADKRRPKPSRSHSPDFTSCTWGDIEYTFTPKQAATVEVLWHAWEDGNPSVLQATILEMIGSDGNRLRDLFRDSETGNMHRAWGKMIVPGPGRGSFMLAT